MLPTIARKKTTITLPVQLTISAIIKPVGLRSTRNIRMERPRIGGVTDKVDAMAPPVLE
jgi:hypothetical protein